MSEKLYNPSELQLLQRKMRTRREDWIQFPWIRFSSVLNDLDFLKVHLQFLPVKLSEVISWKTVDSWLPLLALARFASVRRAFGALSRSTYG